MVYNANKPPISEIENLTSIRPLAVGELNYIVSQTSNHWRKIFNCFAKIAFYLQPAGEKSWQSYRDNRLLQQGSSQQLIFSPPIFEFESNPQQIKIICGRGYFSSLMLKQSELTETLLEQSPVNMEWQDTYFGVDRQNRMIVSPYFDYRQLTNARIDQLVEIIKQLHSQRS